MSSEVKYIWSPDTIVVDDDDGRHLSVRFSVSDVSISARMEFFFETNIFGHLILDSQTDITIIDVIDESSVSDTLNETNIPSILLACEYSRGDLTKYFTFKFFASANGVINTSSDDVKKLLFIFGQYAYLIDTKNNPNIQTEERKPNIVATGIEATGRLIRTGLRVTGEATAAAIVKAGNAYTQYTAGENNTAREYSERDVEEAKKHLARAEWIHSGTSAITGAILYPARWTARKGAELASTHGMETDSLHPVKRAVVDTVAGLGNAVSSVTKGVTEAIGAVGSAIGETTISHSKAKYGDDYTANVTEHYVRAGEEIGKVGYKIGAIHTNGVAGVVLTAVIEGTDMAINLYDYLVGPVILHGYCRMVQLPFRSPVSYFVVLRPWSISFYHSEMDFVQRPFKVLATALLDTLPKIREGDELGFIYSSIPESDTMIDMSSAGADPSVIDGTGRGNEIEMVTMQPLQKQKSKRLGQGIQGDDVGVEGNKEVAIASAEGRQNDENTENQQIEHQESTDDEKYKSQRFIEICTVDCSTYLLWTNDDVLDIWYEELRNASKRVETIAKRKSGAAEIAELKRAASRPKKSVVHMRLGSVIVKAAAEEDKGYMEPGLKSGSSESVELVTGQYADQSVHQKAKGVDVDQTREEKSSNTNVVEKDVEVAVDASKTSEFFDSPQETDGAEGEESGHVDDATPEDSPLLEGNIGKVHHIDDPVTSASAEAIENTQIQQSSPEPDDPSTTLPATDFTTTTATTTAIAQSSENMDQTISKYSSQSQSTPIYPARTKSVSNPPPKRKHRLQLLKSVAPAVLPTIKKTVHEASVWLKDVTRVLVLHNVSVHVVPVAHSGCFFKPEKQAFSPSVLHTEKDNLSSDLVANWSDTHQFLEFGRKLSIDSMTTRGLKLELHTEIPYGGEFILGETELSLTMIPDVNEPELEIWLPLALRGHITLGSIYVQLFVSRKGFDVGVDTE